MTISIILIIPVWVAIVAGIALLGGAVIAVWAFWDDLVVLMQGKKVAIFGGNNTGKTVLFHFLSKGEFTEEYKASFWEKTQKRVFKLEELKMVLRESEDFAGPTFDELHKQWKRLFNESDYCFYNINAKFFIDNHENYCDIVDKHLRLISTWKKDKKKIIMIIVIVFTDELDDFPNNFEKITKKIKSTYSESINILDCPVLAGSMKNKENMIILVKKILKILINTK